MAVIFDKKLFHSNKDCVFNNKQQKCITQSE